MKRLLVLGFLLSVLFVSAAFAENLIVRMKVPEAAPGTVSAASAREARAVSAKRTAEGAGGTVLKVYENLVLDGEVLVLMKPAGDKTAFAEALAKDGNVSGVGFDRPIYGTDLETEVSVRNDSRFHFNTEMIDAPLSGVDTSGQVIYVMDTGADSQGLLGKLVDVSLSRSFIDEPGDPGMPGWQDYEGHGSFVASLAVADGTSKVLGVAPGAKVAAMKVMTADRSGSTLFLVDALNEVAGHRFDGVRAINMSLGYYTPLSPEKIATGGRLEGNFDPLYFALKALTQ